MIAIIFMGYSLASIFSPPTNGFHELGWNVRKEKKTFFLFTWMLTCLTFACFYLAIDFTSAQAKIRYLNLIIFIIFSQYNAKIDYISKNSNCNWFSLIFKKWHVYYFVISNFQVVFSELNITFKRWFYFWKWYWEVLLT